MKKAITFLAGCLAIAAYSDPALGENNVAPEVTNSLGMKLVLIPSGEFMMGSPEERKARSEKDERPDHKVRISKPFYLGRYEVTQGEYEKVMGSNPSKFKGDNRRPVEQVSWNEAVSFCARLSASNAERSAGRQYRLPTEAEWEYACGAGTKEQRHFDDSLDSQHANFNGKYPYRASKGPYLERTTSVGSYPANKFGLHDMHGNVWEWCSDWYDSGYYKGSPLDDPRGPSLGVYRVTRGGGWLSVAWRCRTEYRGRRAPDDRGYGLGFRIASGSSGAELVVRQAAVQ